jgi:hypothetical protein
MLKAELPSFTRLITPGELPVPTFWLAKDKESGVKATEVFTSAETVMVRVKLPLVAKGLKYESRSVVADDTITISPGPRFRAAMVLANIADALQIVVFPLFVEGALSPADDILDFGMAATLVHLLGWHWEFLPSFFAKLVPGVDLVPFWTLAVANVYRKSKAIAAAEESREQHPALRGPQGS